MEKICFTPPDGSEAVWFYVLEQTKQNGQNYLLVTDTAEEDGDCSAILSSHDLCCVDILDDMKKAGIMPHTAPADAGEHRSGLSGKRYV